MGQQSMDVAVQQSTSFPVGVNVDAGPQPMPEATMQVLSAVPKAACAGGPSLFFSSHSSEKFLPCLEKREDIFGKALGELLHPFSAPGWAPSLCFGFSVGIFLISAVFLACLTRGSAACGGESAPGEQRCTTADWPATEQSESWLQPASPKQTLIPQNPQILIPSGLKMQDGALALGLPPCETDCRRQ